MSDGVRFQNSKFHISKTIRSSLTSSTSPVNLDITITLDKLTKIQKLNKAPAEDAGTKEASKKVSLKTESHMVTYEKLCQTVVSLKDSGRVVADTETAKKSRKMAKLK